MFLIGQSKNQLRTRTSECTDSYWNKIAAMGRGISVILQDHQPAWLPCIKLLRDADVNVYGTVNGRKGTVLNPPS